MMMTDKSKIPSGKFKGEALANVPADYLLWLLQNGKCFGELKRYIEDNEEVLLQEVEMKKKK